MLRKVLTTAALLLGALCAVEFTSEVLQVWAVNDSQNANEQGRLIRPHVVDRPEIGIIT